MALTLVGPDEQELRARITVFGVGGAGGNAVNNMIDKQLEGVEFITANTDAQALEHSRAARSIQLGIGVTRGLGAGSKPERPKIPFTSMSPSMHPTHLSMPFPKTMPNTRGATMRDGTRFATRGSRSKRSWGCFPRI